MTTPPALTTLLLMRHGTTGETTAAAFPSCPGVDPDDAGPPLDDGGAAQVRTLRPHLPPVDVIWSSHARRAVQSAALAVGDPDLRTADLAESGFGRWAGRVVADVDAAEPAALGAWMQDPAAGPPGGESFAALTERARRVLARAATVHGVLLAATHGGFVRAAVATVLGAPARSAWGLSIAPASITLLTAVTGDPSTWQLRTVGWQPALAAA